jgi:hypothetical protein
MINTKMAIQEKEKALRVLNTHHKGVKEEKETLINEQAELTERKIHLELSNEDLQEDVDKERRTKV